MTKAPTEPTRSTQSGSSQPEAVSAEKSRYWIDIYRHRWIFIIISVLCLLPGIYFMVVNTLDPDIQAPLRLGIDFKGGTLLEYGFSKSVQQSDVAMVRLPFEKKGYTGSVIQIAAPRLGINQKPFEVGQAGTPESVIEEPLSTATDPSAQKDEGKVSSTQASNSSVLTVDREKNSASSEDPADSAIKSILSIRTKQLKGDDEQEIRSLLEKQFGEITVLQRNSIGPSLAKELMSNGVLALIMAYALIVGYLTIRFQFDFAVCAMIALVHDTLFLFGVFALLGNLFGTEVDSLFVTAVLTVVGFSVHDTIVVFDRIRENLRRYFTKKVGFRQVVNMSIQQTLARSINTSLTALLTMFALYWFGGETTRDFVLAIIIGVAAGTYSSIFNASVLLTMWRHRQETQSA